MPEFKAPCEKMCVLIDQTIADLKSRIGKNLVAAKKCINIDTINSCMSELTGLGMIIYPMSMPDFEVIRMELESGVNELEHYQGSTDALALDQTSLWLCGKELHNDKALKDLIGSNEKSTVIIKLHRTQCGPPPREYPMTDQQRHDMMVHFHKKQDESRKLREDNDDSYLDSEWADNKAFKKSIHDLHGDCKWKLR